MDIEQLRASFSGRLLVEPHDMAPHLVDWRRTWRGIAIAVAQPDSAEGVAAVVRWCAANAVSIVPQGGNSGQSGGSVPEATGLNLVLSLTRLNRVRTIDPVNNTMTVDAGCILQEIQEIASAADRLFPLSLGAEGTCTIGGNLATNAGGTAVLRYGNARDLCLGLEVVTADGEIWDGLKTLRKDNSGYDLRDLFIGSEGTLGVITGAVLKLFPKPVATVVAWVGVDSCADALALFAALQASQGTALTAYELVSDASLDLVLKHNTDLHRPFRQPSRWYVLVELTDTQSEGQARAAMEASLSHAFGTAMIQNAVIADSIAQARGLWQLRERVSEAQAAAGRAIKHDIAVPISELVAFIDEALSAVAAAYPDIHPIIFGHLGDGNLHFNFSVDPSFAEEDRLNAIVHGLVRAHHGTISAEHGLGVLRRHEAHAHRSPIERKLMAAIKHALDPSGIMNPGKLLG